MEFNVQGIVLNSYSTKEADRLYQIFTLEKGLIKATARSVAKSKSKLGGFLTTSNQVFLMLATGKSITRIAQVKVLKTHSRIINFPKEFFLFSTWAKVLLSILPEEQKEEILYNSFSLFLKDLDSDLDLAKKKRLQIIFGVEILRCLGFQPRQINLEKTLVNFLNLTFREEYFKNRNLMLKLKMKEDQEQSLKAWLVDCLQNILDQKINIF